MLGTPAERQQRSSKARAALLSRRKKLVVAAGRTEKSIQRLIARKNGHREEIRELDRQLEALRIQDVLECPLSESVQVLHEQLRQLRIERSRDDILVARQHELNEVEIPGVIIQLQAVCPHPILLRLEGFDGFQTYDYQDARDAGCLCVICHLHENGDRSGSEESFQKLQRHQERVVLYCITQDLTTDPRCSRELSLEDVYQLCRLSWGDVRAIAQNRTTARS